MNELKWFTDTFYLKRNEWKAKEKSVDESVRITVQIDSTEFTDNFFHKKLGFTNVWGSRGPQIFSFSEEYCQST